VISTATCRGLETELDDRSEDITGSIRLLTVSRIDSGVYDEFLGEFHRAYPRIDLHIEVMRSSDIISSLLQKDRDRWAQPVPYAYR